MENIIIEALQASYGDSILITIQEEKGPFTILMDGGTSMAYTFKNKKGKKEAGSLKRKIDELRQKGRWIDLLIVTHVDDDHIGGIKAWFEDEMPSHDFVRRIWMNDDVEITVEKGLDNTSAKAASMKDMLVTNGFAIEHQIGMGGKFNFDWGRMFVLAPTAEHHNKIAKDIAQELNNTIDIRYDVDINTLLKEEWKTDEVTPENNASMAFLLQTNEGENALLLGDANIDTIMTALEDVEGIELPLMCKWVKLSHHGSKNNFKPELLSLVDAENYIVSTNGVRYGHPDKEVIAQLIGKTNATIWFNYPERAEQIFTAQDKADYPGLETRIKQI